MHDENNSDKTNCNDYNENKDDNTNDYVSVYDDKNYNDNGEDEYSNNEKI